MAWQSAYRPVKSEHVAFCGKGGHLCWKWWQGTEVVALVAHMSAVSTLPGEDGESVYAHTGMCPESTDACVCQYACCLLCCIATQPQHDEQHADVNSR